MQFSGDDRIEGRSRENTIDGGLGDDTLIGGVTFGYDDGEGVEFVFRGNTVTGGAGADRFVSQGVRSFLDYGSDRIMDFSSAEGDKIDLSEIMPSITFIGTAAFTGWPGSCATWPEATPRSSWTTMATGRRISLALSSPVPSP